MPILFLALGFCIGAFAYPGPYAYGTTEKGVSYRVNRITGVQQFASSRGWVSERELIRDAMSDTFGGMRDGFGSLGSPTPDTPQAE